MRDIDQAIATMNSLQRLGVQIVIDDFGTGYSSLSALKTFPVARLKIDKSFIKGVADHERSRRYHRRHLAGQKLNLRIVAEGVENDDQIAFLRKNKCDELQGYHFSKPVSARDIEKLLNHED